MTNAYENGVVLAGISAGSACWFEACLTDSFGPLTALEDGLGLLSGSFCPHYNSEPGRPETFTAAVHHGDLPAGVGLDDGAAAKFVNGRLEVVFSADPAADLHPVS
ncbi:Type 1 glutamine amidotransferase-like domain-containing protein [Glycomyces sp. L485]|uniref:Type 1 glutamine amidotransferase-like domain-containing protein n=1 Tax=Glycomyces sp. L485 TaxID=2909235 RepID=UPI001F4B59B7|nr:Type 1 glutamine amidotransferase-like domain-containing protein [Glycomyces sp. L485]